METLFSLLSTFGILIIALFVVGSAVIKIAKEWERGVILRLGRLIGVKGPGIFFLIPFIDRPIFLDLRVITLDVPPQEAITRDNVTVKVNAILYFRVIDPAKAIVSVEDYRRATYNIAQTTLRNVIGQSELDELLAFRERINERLQQMIDEQTEPWGIKVSIVEVKDVELPQTMQRAMAKQAEAEREKRAKVIHAEGEFGAAKQLAAAAAVITKEPAAIQLRYLQTLTEIAVEKNSTIIFPVPVDIISDLSKIVQAALPPAPGADEGPVPPADEGEESPGEDEAAVLCKNCGAQLRPGATFCSKCGASV
jgi:regulator of protease activity HflC (stomatin/prohibitin superfamily)